jgi:hypothetical protein
MNDADLIRALSADSDTMDEAPDPARRGRIVTGVSNNDELVRRTAELAAASCMSDALATEMLPLLADPNSSIGTRSAIAAAFGPALEQAWLEGTDDGAPLSESLLVQVAAGLKAVWDDTSLDEELRRITLEAATHRPEDWMTRHVRVAWQSDDPDWQCTAVRASSRIVSSHDIVRAALDSMDEDVLLAGVQAAGWGDVVGTSDAVIELATGDDEDSELREAALVSLGMLAPPSGRTILSRIIADSSQAQSIRDAAQMGLDMLDLIED